MTHESVAGSLNEKTVREALRQVIDPEAGMNVVELGLVYGVRICDDEIGVDLTMTTPACPMGEMIVDEARTALRTIAPPGTRITVNLVWDPPWSPAMMSDTARRHFGWT